MRLRLAAKGPPPAMLCWVSNMLPLACQLQLQLLSSAERKSRKLVPRPSAIRSVTAQIWVRHWARNQLSHLRLPQAQPVPSDSYLVRLGSRAFPRGDQGLGVAARQPDHCVAENIYVSRTSQPPHCSIGNYVHQS